MDKAVYEVLQEVLSEKGLSIAEVSRICGLPDSTVRGIIARKQKKIALDVAFKLSAGLNIDIRSLSSEPIDPKKTNDDSTDNVFNYPNIFPVKTRKFPLLGEIAAGVPIYAEEDHETYIEASSDIRADFCLTAKGDSMTGARIFDGDVVFVRKQEIVDNGEVAAVIIDDEATLKRVYYYPKQNKLVLASENSKYPPFMYVDEELEQIHILGKAVAFMSVVR